MRPQLHRSGESDRMSAEVQAQMRRLAEQTTAIGGALKTLNDGCAASARQLRSVAENRSISAG